MNQQITITEIQALIGEYELGQRVWKREFEKLAQRLVEVEAELRALKGEPEEQPPMVTPPAKPIILPTNLGQNGHTHS